MAHFKTAKEYAARIEIQELPDFFVLYERFIGNYVELERHWYQFLELYQAYLEEETILVERFFHDPAITSLSQCICDICMTVKEDCNLDNLMRIKGGRWIVRIIGLLWTYVSQLNKSKNSEVSRMVFYL